MRGCGFICLALFVAANGALFSVAASPEGDAAPEAALVENLRKEFFMGGKVHRRVTLTCQVVSRVGNYLLLHDESGGMSVRAPAERFPFRAGDNVQLTCAVPSEEKPAAFSADVLEGQCLSHAPPPEPRPADIASVLAGKLDYRPVRLSGVITDAFRDETDPDWIDFVLEACNLSIVLTMCDGNSMSPAALDAYIDRAVWVDGVCDFVQGLSRKNRGRIVSLTDERAIREMSAADDEASGLVHRVRRTGAVLASWRDSAFFLQCDDGERLRVYLGRGAAPPLSGRRVEVAGFLRKDEFFTSLSNAIVLKDEPGAVSAEPAVALHPREVLFDETGQCRMRPTHDGRLISLRARVKDVIRGGTRESSMLMDCDGLSIEVETGALPTPGIGSVVAVTGVCRFDTSPRQGGYGGLRLDGITVLPRRASDIVVIAPPPWWTPGRLQAAVGSLLALLAGFVVWNRILNRAISRRCRELLRARLAQERADLKTGERTRLAVELHDSLSQNLSGVACQITAACEAILLGPEALRKRLETAGRMLDSCRTELKRCLWDLRGSALEEPDLSLAIRKTLDPIIGDCRLFVRFPVSRARLTDTTVHSIICIVRELCSNAVRHGHATVVRVAGCADGAMLKFSVEDNGVGFDPTACAGPAEGHFGLEGVRERAGRLCGTMSVVSARGQGTKVRVNIAASQQQED